MYEGRRRAENLAFAGPPLPTTACVDGDAWETLSRVGGGLLVVKARGKIIGFGSSPS